MKKDNNKTANIANTAAKPAKNPAEMTILELQALKSTCKGIMLSVVEALITEKTRAAELEAKVKSSKAREPKAPDSYDVLQPVFVALRGNIGKGIVTDSILVDMFQYAVHVLNIDLSADIQNRLFEKTVQHNSTSNIAKVETLASAEGRKAAYIEMTEQARIMLPKITEDEWAAYKAAYDTAYDKAVSKLKK